MSSSLCKLLKCAKTFQTAIAERHFKQHAPNAMAGNLAGLTMPLCYKYAKQHREGKGESERARGVKLSHQLL